MSELTPIQIPNITRAHLALGALFLPMVLLFHGLAYAACGIAPTVSLDSAAKYAPAGDSVDYLVTITNNAAGSCDLDLTVSGDVEGFTSSLPDGTPFTVPGGGTETLTLRVAVDSDIPDWVTNTTTLSVEGVDNLATTTVFDNNPLLHNSINLGSAKHGGNWGTTKAGSKYGSFTCQTCHVKGSTNIKRIRNRITTPDDSSGTLPGDGQPIVFKSAENGSADMGNDTGGHGTSDRVCEVCHTYDPTGANGVRYHAYNMPADSGHFNATDCIGCHKHKTGFKASCSSCHGGGTVGGQSANFWPDGSSANAENDTPGRHLAHMDALAQIKYGMNAVALLNDMAASAKQTDLCGYCHDNPGADADHAEPGPAETAFYPVWNKSAAASGSYTAGDGNCTNLCHNSRATGVGTYGWLDSGTSQCIMCHNNINVTTAGTTGATHDRHLNLASDFGPTLGCDDCHDAATDWSGNNAPNDGLHINGALNIAGDKVADDEYTGTSIPGANFGSCSGGVSPNLCHNDGSMTAAPARNYVWGNALSNDCASCHTAVPASNAHPTHVATADSSYGGGTPWPAGNNSTAGYYDFSCVNCHGTTRANHLNGMVSLTGVGYLDATADTVANGTCASAACHSDGTSPVNYSETPAWNASFTPGACDGCHGNIPDTAGHPQHVLEVGFHYDAIYSGLEGALPVVDGDDSAVDQGLDDGDGDPNVVSSSNSGFDQLRGHGGNLTSDGTVTSTVVSCNVCHIDTITVNTNDLATYADADPKTRACAECHDDSTTAKLGIARIADKSKHVNGAINVRFFDEKVRSKAQVRDENAYNLGPDGTPVSVDDPDEAVAWTKTTELTNNWQRVNGYKALDGSSYDEQPETLHNMATAYYAAENPDDPNPEENYYSTTDKTCMISCHLWEAGRVDKAPVHWVDNATDGSAPLMCIDCHSRLPK